jgi:hypothetical protein
MATGPEASAAEAMRALSDAELVSASLPGASMAGCVPWLLAFTLPWPVGLIWGAPAALLALALGITVSKLSGAIRAARPAQRRARLAEHEFERRYARAAFQEAERAATAAIAGAAEPSAIALLHACSLPHGGLYFASLHVGAQIHYAGRHAPFLGDLQQHPEWMEQLRNEAATLDATEAQRVRAILAALPSRLEIAIDDVVLDGTPCEALVLRKEREPLRVGLNLDGLRDEHRDHPVAQLLTLMLGLAAPVPPSRRARPR